MALHGLSERAWTRPSLDFIATALLVPSHWEPARMDRMKFTSLYEKFMVAVDVLATSPASLQKQLEGAYRSFIDIEPEDFDDDEMQATFEQIRSRLTRSPTGTDRCHRCDLQANVRVRNIAVGPRALSQMTQGNLRGTDFPEALSTLEFAGLKRVAPDRRIVI